MKYKFENRDRINFDAEHIEMNCEAYTLAISIFRDQDWDSHSTRNQIDIQLNEDDLENMIIALTNIHTQIVRYKNSK